MSALPNPVGTSQAEKQMLLELLRVSRERFLSSFAGVSEGQSRCRPVEGSWSVLDTVEHLAFAETAMLRLITETRCPRTPGASNREELFLQAVANRSRKIQSPEIAVPCGRFADLMEASQQFRKSRDEVMQFVEQCTEDLRATEVTHPHPFAGVVSTFEMIIIVAKHAERHALQVEEIKNSPAFREQASAKG